MQGKSTSALERELSACADLRGYLKKNTRELRAPELPELLCQLAAERNLSRAEVARRSCMNTIYTYQIFSGRRHPGRESLLCLCFGLDLRAEQAQTLLLHAGFAQLYVRNRRESIIYHALEMGLSLPEVNQQLFELGETVLG